MSEKGVPIVHLLTWMSQLVLQVNPGKCCICILSNVLKEDV